MSNWSFSAIFNIVSRIATKSTSGTILYYIGYTILGFWKICQKILSLRKKFYGENFKLFLEIGSLFVLKDADHFKQIKKIDFGSIS